MKTSKYTNSILLVEDNPVDIDLTLRAFKKNNLVNTIHVARNGVEAMEYVKRWDNGIELPSLILLDIKLPVMDGLEVLSVLKKHETYRTIPVVILTSSSDNIDIKKAYALGANSYIVKPVDFVRFVDVATQIESYWNTLNVPSK